MSHWLEIADAIKLKKKLTKAFWKKSQWIELREDGHWVNQDGFLFDPNFNEKTWRIVDDVKRSPWDSTLNEIEKLCK